MNKAFFKLKSIFAVICNSFLIKLVDFHSINENHKKLRRKAHGILLIFHLKMYI